MSLNASLTSPAVANVIRSIVMLDANFKLHCICLKEQLINANVISSLTTYAEVRNNKTLMNALLQQITLHLSKEVGSSSPAGWNIFSEYDLFHHMKSDPSVRLACNNLNPPPSEETITILKRNRRNLVQRMRRLLLKILLEMDLEETPMDDDEPPSTASEKKKDKKKTSEKSTPRKLFDEEAEEADDDGMDDLSGSFNKIGLDQEDEPAQEVPAPARQEIHVHEPDQTTPRRFRGVRSSETVKGDRDLYESDPRILDCLLEFLGEELKSDTCILEPCCGREMRLVHGLHERGFNNVVPSDIEKYSDETVVRDFLKEDMDDRGEFIITNPPFSLKKQFVSKCFKSGKPFALVLPIDCLGRAYMKRILRAHACSHVIVIPPSLRFKKDNRSLTIGVVVWLVGNLQTDKVPMAYFHCSTSTGDSSASESEK